VRASLGGLALAFALLAPLACAEPMATAPRPPERPPPPLVVPPPPAPPDYTCVPPDPLEKELAYDGRTMLHVCENVHVDPATPPGRHAFLRDVPARAAARAAAFYGPLRGSRPLIIFCHTDACRVFFTGPDKRGRAIVPDSSGPEGRYFAGARWTLVIVRTDARAEDLLTHEISHLELDTRLRGGRVPAWFNEGLATYISGEPDCAAPLPPAVADLRTLDTGDAWLAQTSAPERQQATYCQARAAVAAWLGDDGRARCSTLVQAVSTGTAFDRAWR
jgi:hypothetical protein